ncbi:type II secretion system protein [Thiomicrospira microaerophila]|uniref:type II secretion system protein n=1 Tax=Thiomicrospira microaerophila TaxID=406020 RepID=UPI0006988360|nr:hypothetical protein [Thiomicrospira microaerophila]
MATKQRGFSLIYFLIILGVGSGVLLYAVKPSVESLKFAKTTGDVAYLKDAKNALLIFAASTPELFATDTNDPPNFYPSSEVIGPGYLPCATDSPTGQMIHPCGMSSEDENGLVMGYLPQNMIERHFSFYPTHKVAIQYVVDSRYVFSNNDHNTSSNVLTPLNRNQIGSDPAKTDLIQVGNQTDIVAFLLIDSQNNAEDYRIDPAAKQFNRPDRPAIIITLTHDDWLAGICPRIISQKNHLDALDSTQAHWYNAKSFSNPVGSNWRNNPC